MSMVNDAERLQSVLTAATLGVWEIDLSTQTLTCSAQCKANFGRPTDQPFTLAELMEAIHPSDRLAVTEAIAAACTGEHPYYAEYRIGWPDGSTRWISAQGTLEYAGGRPSRLLGVTIDVTRHKAAQEAERAAKEFSHRLVESSADCIKVLDLDGRILWVSAAGLALLGAPSEALVGRAWVGFWKDDVRELVRASMARAIAQGSARFEARSRTFTDVLRWWDVRVTPIHDAEGTPERLLVVSTDITERKLLEDALRRSCEELEERVCQRTSELHALGKRLENVREDERTRLARDLHDQLGQTLTSLKLDTRMATRLLGPDEARLQLVRSRLRDIEALLDDTLVTLEHIVSELRPAVLDELGFGAAAEWHVRQFAARSGINTSFSCPDDLNLTGDVATAFFRVLQEALTNVARHAGADVVTVALCATQDGFVLDVTDNGRGLPLDRGAMAGFGIRGMEERLRAVGGKLTLGNAPRGARLVARVPMRRAS